MPAHPATLAFQKGTLLLGHVPSALASQMPGALRFDARVKAWVADAMHYAALVRALRDAGVDVDNRVEPPQPLALPPGVLPPLRKEQTLALKHWSQADRRGVVVMPTGTGKTVVALHAMEQAGVATLVVAPVRDLMYQWHRRIQDAFRFDAGLVGDQHFVLRPITVATYDSAYLHMDKMGDRFGLIVFDEVHHLPARSIREAALMCTAPMRLGLTATPERADGRHADLDALVGPAVYRVDMAEVAGKTLAPYDVVRIPVTLTGEEQQRYDAACAVVRQYMADRRQENAAYAFQDLLKQAAHEPEARRAQKAYYRKKSMEDRAKEKLRVLEDLFTLHAGERVLVFTGSNAMAMDISRRFLVPTLLAFHGKKERHAVLQAFSDGKMPVLVANQVLDEGVDVPAAKVCVVVGGQASTRQAKQRLGRILRQQGGQRATLYEVVVRDTAEEARSRTRRRSDAYRRPVHPEV